jgi:hypothetical protein
MRAASDLSQGTRRKNFLDPASVASWRIAVNEEMQANVCDLSQTYSRAHTKRGEAGGQEKKTAKKYVRPLCLRNVHPSLAIYSRYS